MAGIQDFVEYCEDFLGSQSLTASPAGSDIWDIADTSVDGTPTYTVGGINGEATLAFDNEAEAQNVCLFMSDRLNFDIDRLLRVEMAVKTVASLDSATSLAFGMASARNDAIDSITAHASFRLIGNNSVVVETDDGTTDLDDKATGTTLVATYKRFVIDFSGGASNVKFYIDGVQVAASTTFDMSAYTAGLQPYVQIQKTSDNNTDSVTVDYIKIVSRR
jgi:hypothetical protein